MRLSRREFLGTIGLGAIAVASQGVATSVGVGAKDDGLRAILGYNGMLQGHQLMLSRPADGNYVILFLGDDLPGQSDRVVEAIAALDRAGGLIRSRELIRMDYRNLQVALGGSPDARRVGLWDLLDRGWRGV